MPKREGFGHRDRLPREVETPSLEVDVVLRDVV